MKIFGTGGTVGFHRNGALQSQIVRLFRMGRTSPYFYGKWAFHTDRVSDFLRGDIEAVKPITAEFVPTLYCNHSCPTCTYGEQKSDAPEDLAYRLMDKELMKDLLLKLQTGGIKAAIFTGGGEPLMNPHTFTGMRHAKELGLDAGLFTNGDLLDREKSKELLEIAPAFVRISLNAGTPESHQAMQGLRSTNSFFRVIENLTALARLKYETGSATSVGVGILVDSRNMRDLVCLRMWMEEILTAYPGSIDYVAFRPTVIYGGKEKKQFPAEDFAVAQKIINGVLYPHFCSLGLETINLKERFNDVNAPRDYEYCLAHPWRLSVAPNGGIYICAENNMLDDFYFGSLTNQTLDEIWGGERRRNVIDALNNGRMAKRCPPICVLTYMNRIFEQLRLHLKEGNVEELEKFLEMMRKGASPTHVNFL